MPPGDAATLLGVNTAEVERWIRLGKIMLDGRSTVRQVLVNVEFPAGGRKFSPCVPHIRHVFQAVRLTVESCDSDDLAGQLLDEFKQMGFTLKEGAKETTITPTDELKVATVPDIEKHLHGVSQGKARIAFEGYTIQADERLL